MRFKIGDVVRVARDKVDDSYEVHGHRTFRGDRIIQSVGRTLVMVEDDHDLGYEESDLKLVRREK